MENSKCKFSKGTILSHLLSLICISDLPEVQYNTVSWLYFLFSIVNDIALPENQSYEDFIKISNGVYQRKMTFNLDPSK